jgi:hypothetical protein
VVGDLKLTRRMIRALLQTRDWIHGLAFHYRTAHRDAAKLSTARTP